MSATTTSTPGPPVHKAPLRVLVVTGVYPTEQAPHRGTFIKSQVDSLALAGLHIEVLHPKPGPAPLRFAITAAQVFLKSLSRRFDVVHGHYGHWCLAARMQWTMPVVASFMGSDLLGVPTADGRFSQKGRLVTRITRWLAPRVDAVIVKSDQMKQEIPASNVVVIPNGVDFHAFYPLPRTHARIALGWDPNRYYVLFGNDPGKPVKDFPLAQAAIERLRDRGIPADLVVASGLPQATVMLYINASNALLLSSKSEGSPNIVKEAMACNVPIVSVDVGDVSQVIGGTEGCWICPRDPAALAAVLERTLRFSCQTTGRGDIAHLECSNVAQQVIAVFAAVTGRRVQELVGSSDPETVGHDVQVV